MKRNDPTTIQIPLGIDGRVTLATDPEHMTLGFHLSADDVREVLLPAIRLGFTRRNLKEISRSLFRAAYFQAEADMGIYMQEWLRDTLAAGAEAAKQQNNNRGKQYEI